MWMFKLDILLLLWGLYFMISVCHELGNTAWKDTLPRITFSREALMRLRPSGGGTVPPPPSIPPELRVLVANPRRRRRGRRGGILRRLKRMSLQDRRKLPALPTVLLGNAQSLRNKLDELEAWTTTRQEIRNACLLVFTESWLSEADRDEDLTITGFGAPLRLDRDKEVTNKQRGGGVCCYVNERYCKTVVVRERICTTDIELLSVSLRPFYLPREFQQLFFTIVYIHPRADAGAAVQLIDDVTHRLDAICPDAPKFILGDFNHCRLDKTFKTYEQYVTCATTQRNTTLDLCFGSVSGAYRSLPLPPLGLSYHNCVYLMPRYTPAFKRLPRVEKSVKCWTEDSISALQACFECTDWNCFFNPGEDINELCDTVSSYVTFCVDSVVPSKTVVIYPNNRPWVNKELKSVINRKKVVYSSGGNPLEKKAVSREVRDGIRKAKLKYKDKMEEKYSSGDLRAAWQGIKCMASINHQKGDNKLISVQGVPDPDLPNVFNSFFSRFERADLLGEVSARKESLDSSGGIMISQDQVTALLRKVKVGKARGPDNICGRTLHHCATQLSGVFSRLFQSCVDLGQIPTLWKTSTVIPIPKSRTSKELSDFRPVALTSLVMKTFEKILKSEILFLTEGKLDPLQFAYQQNKGVEDASLFLLNTVYKHLDRSGAHVRLLFADFSSAFNKMQPHILIERLLTAFNLPDQLLLLILNFLTDRIQRVLVNGRLSTASISNTGSPQGCVLSPLLFILYTDSCRVTQKNRFLVKFSDDTVLVSLLSGPEASHGPALTEFVQWCDNNYLDLNVSKTKDMVIDFRRSTAPPLGSSVIHSEAVEVVEKYKYLGSWIDNKLRFDANTDSIFKRGQQRIYLLRKLNSFNVNKRILCNFYSCFIESLLTFSFVCWFRGLSVKDKNKLQNIVKICSKIIGVKQRDLESLWKEQALKKAKCILSQPLHALSSEFSLMPSGRRFYVPCRKTNRFSNSFVPSVTELLNSEGAVFK